MTCLPRPLRARAFAALWFAFVVAAPAPARAQAYPSKPIRFILPYAPGGSGDFLARLFGDQLAKNLGQSVVIENRPGAATNIALEQFVRMDPDGYSIMMGTGQTMINMSFSPVPSVDPFQTLAPAAMIAEMPLIIGTNPQSGLAGAKDMVEQSKIRRLTIGHAQFDAQVRLMIIATGAQIDPIPYKGGAGSVMAGLSGEVSMVASYVPVVLGHIKSGKMKAVGIAASSRIAALPDVPTFAEQGFPKFQTSIWYNILAPKGTPENVMKRLTQACLTIARDPFFVEKLQASGTEPMPRTPEETLALMREERKLWAEVAKAK